MARLDERDACHRLRHEVFTVEQGVDATIERDGRDAECLHYLALFEGSVVATLRLRPLDDSRLKLERMAVSSAHRRGGVGRALVQGVLADLPAEVIELVLDAQAHAIPFYAGLGFHPEGEPFTEAGIEHLRMRLAVR